ncbi:hypothetical protein [Phosphitispora fastidiosa]|uniref:hypothetical protein n=1 Tax=Phosphitispora fastidiosa TaxID=2837202 RepID=UPI001E409112|nr:hypothetical protein [Phosphitispora fastidiosa]MBU7006286.1 hypothetical protein [Phosphitispora fastidiosa]
MNLVQRGYCRDNSILATLEDYKTLNIQQIIFLHFTLTEFKTYEVAKRKAQERMLKLHRKGMVERWASNEGYVYGEKTAHWQHRILLNWVRVYIELQKACWEKTHCFKYEPDYSFLRPDGFCAIKNTVTERFRFMFIEGENHSDRNDFNKVRLYNKLFEQINRGYKRWWVTLTDKFPPVLIVCQTENRKEKILRKIQEDNANGLRFSVKLLEELRRCLK